MTVEQIEVRVMVSALNNAWRDFVSSNESNYQQSLNAYLKLLDGVKQLDGDLRAEILKRMRG